MLGIRMLSGRILPLRALMCALAVHGPTSLSYDLRISDRNCRICGLGLTKASQKLLWPSWLWHALLALNVWKVRCPAIYHQRLRSESYIDGAWGAKRFSP